MPNRYYKHKWLYFGFAFSKFAHVGKQFYGLVWDRLPLLVFFVDVSWYYPSISLGFVIGPLEIGLFIEHKKPERHFLE